jgi:hypothetical protein
MAHDIIDNRNEKLVDHIDSALVSPSQTLSLKGREYGMRAPCHENGVCLFFPFPKSDGASLRLRRRHKLADSIKDDLKLRVVLFLKVVESAR